MTLQRESSQSIPVPVVTDHFVNIYKPQEDVYTLPARQVRGRGQCTFSYEQGNSYPDWRTNDHTFIRGHNSRWHCFGITKPWMPGTAPGFTRQTHDADMAEEARLLRMMK